MALDAGLSSPLSKLTDKRKKKFLDELAQAQSVSYAARMIAVSRQALYHLRSTDQVFKHAWDDAIEQGADALEDEAVRRAVHGSDTLLIFLLKGARPDKFRERYEHTGAKGGPLEIKVVYGE